MSFLNDVGLTDTQAEDALCTVRALVRGFVMHEMQEAFLETGAFQCGYCTSGMIISGVALLARNANPSEAEILQAMQGNICRCGAYPRIVAAIRLASEKMRRHAA